MKIHDKTERYASRVLGINRTVFRYEPVRLPEEDEIRSQIIYLATNCGRVGYRMVTAMLRNEGIQINHKRVERIWREEGLKLPEKQAKKRRLWLSDGSCIRLRAEHRNHVWSYDFVEDRTIDGRKVRLLNILDEYTHEYLASIPRRSWRNAGVITAYIEPGSPWENGYIESFNCVHRSICTAKPAKLSMNSAEIEQRFRAS